MKKIILCIMFIIYMTMPIYANGYTEGLDLEKYDTIINKSIGEDSFSFSKIIKEYISGGIDEISLTSIIEYVIQGVFKELFVNSNIIKNVIILSILVAFLKILSENFKNKGVSEIGFYAGYMLICTLLINSFTIATNIVYESISSITTLIDSIMPILVGILVISGASGSGAIFSTTILTSLKIASIFMEYIFIPFVSATVVLNIVNYITPKEVLNKLTEFLKWSILFSLKAMATIFVFIISMQRVISPAINSTINKTVKTAITFIPVIGDIMTGSIESVMHFVGLLKGGVFVAFIVAIAICSLIPIFKLLSLVILYKITAVLIEPISDRRITSSIDMLGEYTKLLLSSLFIFIVMFILFVAIMLSVSG